MADEIEGTFDKLKAGAKAVAKKVTDPSKDLGDEDDKEKGKENSTGYEQTTDSGTSDPMSPEKIASHESTAVRRDPSQDASGEPVSSPIQIILTFKAINLERALLNQMSQHQVYLLPSVVKNAGKHLVLVRS